MLGTNFTFVLFTGHFNNQTINVTLWGHSTRKPDGRINTNKMHHCRDECTTPKKILVAAACCGVLQQHLTNEVPFSAAAACCGILQPATHRWSLTPTPHLLC